jgi:nitrous oxide reductase accessory protein NosL
MKQLTVILLMIVLLAGCSATGSVSPSREGPADFNAMGQLLGCIFAPNKCPKNSQTTDLKNDSDWDSIK